MSNVNIDIHNTNGVPDKLTGTITAQSISLVPSSGDPTDDQAVWGAIRHRASAASFTNFEKFIAIIFCKWPPPAGTNIDGDLEGAHTTLLPENGTSCYHGSESYNLLKAAAEVFLALQCGIKVRAPFNDDGTAGNMTGPISDEAGRGATNDTFADLEGALQGFVMGNTRLYLHTILNSLHQSNAKSPLCEGILLASDTRISPNPTSGERNKELDCFPCMLELIWSYWHEEAMLVQSLNALCLRFQNKRGPRARDPLANLRLDPLRPPNTLLWGYIQDEINRLTVARRAYETR